MNQRKTKELRKILLKKTSAVLVLIREHYGEDTKNIESPQAVWRLFKRLYKQGKVPAGMFRTSERSIKLNDKSIELN